jgi:hypothetical protein
MNTFNILFDETLNTVSLDSKREKKQRILDYPERKAGYH